MVIVATVRAEAAATVVQCPETLRRIAAGELNPDGTPAVRNGGRA